MVTCNPQDPRAGPILACYFPAFVASPGLELKYQVQDCGFVFSGFKAATSSSSLQAKVLSTTANEGGNAMLKDSLELLGFFLKHDLAEVSEQIPVQCQPCFNGTLPVTEFSFFSL